MILWPEVLPQQLLVDGYGEQLANQIIRTEMDAGPAKVRRRFTAAPRPISGEIVVTPAQLVFFRYWYYNVLLGGSLRFGWTDPFTTDELTNLLTNGGFDSATTGWTVADSTLASVTGGVYGNCIEVTRSAGDRQFACQYFVDTTIGNTYNLSGYTKSGTSGDEYSSIIAIDDEVMSGILYLTNITAASWQYYHNSFDAVTDSTGLQLVKESATAGTMLFDQVSLVDITSGVVEMRFTQPPTITPIDPLNIRISMQLEILPL